MPKLIAKFATRPNLAYPLLLLLLLLAPPTPLPLLVVELGKSLPLSDQVILGVGLPLVEHLRETGGPGCIV